MKVLSNLSLYGTLGLNSVVDANTDTDKFLVIDSNGIVKYRTGQELYNDIGAGGAASYTSTLQHEVKAGVALTKGQAVYVTSADGTNMIVSKASNASEATSSKTLGLIAQDLNINGKGYVITEGLLSGLNTMAAGTEGDPVWLGTDGNLIYGLGSKPYAPAHLVFIGIVTRRNANNGEIFVKVQNGFELQELHNVQITSTPSDNTVLAYETSTSLYKMKSIPTLLGYTPTTNARTLTINGTSYDLSADRSWSVGTHTGNLTTGYVPKATGATTLTDSLIYDNGSAIGINTNAPYESSAFKLDVNGGVIIKNTNGTAAQLILINSNPATGGNNGFVQLSAGGNTATAFGQWQTYYGMSVAAGALRLQPAGGQVLIGTTTTSAFTTDINGTLRVSGQLTLGSTISNNTYVYTMPGASGTLALVSQIPSLSGYVQTSRTLTINGVSYDLSADRSWSITAGVSSVLAGTGISVSNSSGTVTVSNTGLLSGTAGSGISVSTSGQNLNIVNTGLLSGTAGSGISVSNSGQNLNIVNTGLLSATAGSGISVSTSSQNVNIVNTGLLSATAGTGISVSTSSGVLTVTNTITNTNQLTNGAGYITGINSSMVTSALGYTPYNSSNPNGYISSYTETDTLASVTARGATTTSAITINKTGTLISHAGMSDAIGYNSSYGTYIGSPVGGTYYIYANGQMYNNGPIVTLLHSGNYSSYALPLSGGTMSGTIYFTDTTNGIYKSGGRFTVRSESTDNVANFASYGLYLPVMGQTAGLYVESPIEARGGLRIGSGAGSGTINVGADTGVVGSRLVQRDANGYIYANHVNFSTPESENPTISSFITSNGDGWSRKSSLQHVRNQLGNYGGWITGYTETDTLASVTGRGASTASQVSFTKTDDHAISVGTIRGRAVGSQGGEFIQLYERVNIGGPSGWGASNTGAPTYGLSVYGGANIGYGNNASLYAYAYRGNGNVGGTGEASWHPAGIYSGGTQWLYGTTYRNNATTSGQGQMYFDGNFGYGMVGLYASTRYQAIFAMGDAYKLPVDGTSTGSLYGMAWSHPNAGGVASNLNTHGLLVMENGTFLAAVSGSIRARDDMRAPIFYDSADTTFYGDFAGTSRINSLNMGYVGGTVYNNAVGGTLFFNSNNESDIQGYSIGTTLENFGGNYTKLTIDWHTGIRIGASSGYGGIRFYNNSVKYYGGSQVFSIAEGDNNVRVTNNLLVGPNANRPIVLDTGGGSILVKGNTGGWSMGTYYRGSSDTILAGFGAYGGGNSLTWAWIGSGYENAWMTFNGGAANSLVALQQQGNQVLHAGNFTSYAAAVNGNVSNTFSVFQLSYDSTNFNPSAAPRSIMNPMSIKMWNNYFNGTGLGSDYGTVMQYYSLGGHVDSQVYFDASGGSWYRTSPYASGWGAWQKYVTENGGTWSISITGNSGNASALGGYAPSTYLGKLGNGNGYYQADNWIQVNNSTGIFWPSYYNFHIRPNIASTYTQMEIIGSKSGYSGIYDNASAVNLGMYDSGGNGGVYRETNGRWYWYYHVGNNSMGIGSSANSSSYVLYASGSIYATGDVVAYSDVRKKTNIVTIDNALETVTKMRGVFYDKIGEEEKGRQLGVIAQEVDEVLPEAVSYAKDIDEYGVKYGNLGGLFIEAIKEQQKQIEDLKSELNALTK